MSEEKPLLSFTVATKEPEMPKINIQRTKSEQSLFDMFDGGFHSRKDFLNYFEKNADTHKEFTRQSPGYVSLMLYIKNQDNMTQNRPNKGKGMKQQPNKSATLFVKTQNRYIPKSDLQAVHMWKGDSDEAFLDSAYFLLNKLTENQIHKTINELNNHIKNPHHIDLLTNLIYQKAESEPPFAHVYASLTCELSDDAKQQVIKRCSKEFSDWLTNPPTNQSETQNAIGCSKFLASLLSRSLFKFKDGNQYLTDLLKKLRDILNPANSKSVEDAALIEMLQVFIEGAGKEFCKQISKSNWNIFDECLKKEGPATRKGCLLLNVQDLKDMWLSNQIAIQKHSQPIEKTKDNESIEDFINSSFIDYLDGTDLKPISYTNTEFLRAALHLLPQHCKEPGDYGLFIVQALLKCKQNPSFSIGEINDILKEYADIIKKDNLIEESPKIWHSFFYVITALYAFAMFFLRGVDEIYSKFPEGHTQVDWLNEAKYFLYLYYTFSEDVKIQKHPHAEIADALHMPGLINSPIEKYSRLTAIAICRVVINNARLVEPQKALDVVAKYVQQLRHVYKSFPSVFEEEFNSALDEGIFISLEGIKSRLR